MPKLMNELRIRCPKCASEKLSPVSVEVNRAEPPANVMVDESTITIGPGDGTHKVVVKVHCDSCGAGVFWISTVFDGGEVWVKLAADPDEDEQGPQP